MSEYVVVKREVVERVMETVATLCAAITANDDDTMYQRSLMWLDAAVGALRAALDAGDAQPAVTEEMVAAACRTFSEQAVGYGAETRREYMVRCMPMRAALIAALEAKA